MPTIQKVCLIVGAVLGFSCIAAAQEKPQVQSYHVECTSQGEQCNKSVKIRLPAGSDNWTLSLIAPTENCSDVQYIINRITYTGGYGTKRYPKASQFVEIWRGGWLGAGASDSYSFIAGSTPAFFLTAEGREGGCNQGTLASWGVGVQLNPN